jgi:putative membrane protein
MYNVKKALQGGFAAALMVGAMSVGVAAQSGQLSPADKMFVNKAAQGGMAEVELGQLATQKGQSQQVKDFGQKMVDDHSKANDQLKSIASQENITLPTGLDAKDQAVKDRLSKLSGAQFDKAYMQDMVQDHNQDVAEFQKEASNGKDPAVKNFAQQTLPVLKEHLKMAETSQQAVSEGKSKGMTTASNQEQ